MISIGISLITAGLFLLHGDTANCAIAISIAMAAIAALLVILAELTGGPAAAALVLGEVIGENVIAGLYSGKVCRTK